MDVYRVDFLFLTKYIFKFMSAKSNCIWNFSVDYKTIQLSNNISSQGYFPLVLNNIQAKSCFNIHRVKDILKNTKST